MSVREFALAAAAVCVGAMISAGCGSRDANLETLEYATSTISLDSEATAHLIAGNRVEVDGTATNHDKFQHDVYFTATLWDAGGKPLGTATGKLEDWPAGHHGAYKLIGTTASQNWARVTVVVSNVKEHVRGQPED